MTFAFGYVIFIFLGPVIFTARYSTGLWDKEPINIIAFGDQIYGIWLLLIPVIAAGLLLFAWREAERKAALGE